MSLSSSLVCETIISSWRAFVKPSAGKEFVKSAAGDQDDHADHKSQSHGDPDGRQHPQPGPRDHAAQLETDEKQSQKTVEADADSSLVVVIHVLSLSSLVDRSIIAGGRGFVNPFQG